jgi:hypothetical protein
MIGSLLSEVFHSVDHGATEGWPCCRLRQADQANAQAARLAAIARLDLGAHRHVPAFEEAAQVAARFLNAPVSWVSVATSDHEWLQGAYGLYGLGLGNSLATQRQLPLAASLSPYVIDSEQPLVLPDLSQFPLLAQVPLVADYGLAAYCGVPLITSEYECIGVLAVVDDHPRQFSQRDITFLAMAARWGMAEYERSRSTLAPNLIPKSPPSPPPTADSQIPDPMVSPSIPTAMADVRLNLLAQLVEDLRSPLTAVLGMTSVLSQEVYGPLTEKQREYTEIAWRSSQAMMAQVDEIVDLGLVNPDIGTLVPALVDIERVVQQVVTMLNPLAEKLSLTVKLSTEPEQNLWILDQQLVKQVLYYTLFSVMHMAGENSTLRLHTSRKQNSLAVALWLANPWTGDGLPPSLVSFCQSLETPGPDEISPELSLDIDQDASRRNWLGLQLGVYLVRYHGGEIRLYGNDDSGHRLGIQLPCLKPSLATSTLGDRVAAQLP